MGRMALQVVELTKLLISTVPFLCLYTAWWKGYVGIERDCAVEKTQYFCPINQMTNK